MATERPVSTQAYGEIYDLGYKHYDGPRLGRSQAIQSLIVYSIKRGLGIKKRWTSKLMPIFLYVAAYAPALIAAGIMGFIPGEVTFDYLDLNGFITPALLIFAAGLAPEMLSDDRRENVLPLYFSRALTRLDYLLAKMAAMGILMGTIAFGPPLLLFLATSLLDDNPLTAIANNITDLGKIAVYGTLLSGYLASLGLAVASYVNRKGVASALFIGGLILITALANALFDALDSTLGDYVIFLSPLDLIEAVGNWIYNGNQSIPMAQLPGIAYPIGMIVTAMIAAGVMFRRYLSED